MGACMAEFEKNVGAQLYMAAMEWAQGGVDEATFISKLVPIFKENMTKQMANPDGILDNALAFQSGPQAEMGGAIAKQALQALKGDESWPAAIKKAQETAATYMPDACRVIFKFLDLDNNGTVSRKEIQLLKHVMDAAVNLGERAVAKPGDIGATAEGDTQSFVKDLMVAVFEILDRDGDGKVTVDELVDFAQRVIVFF